MRVIALSVAAGLCAATLHAAPLPQESVPEVLKGWIPWVLHGHERIACPPAHDNGAMRECVWPSELELELDAGGGSFRLRAETFARGTTIALPGDAEHWPQEVRSAGALLAVSERAGRPFVELPPGAHLISGRLAWRDLPQSLSLPPAAGVVRATLQGKPLTTQPDAEGRLWLRRGEEQAAPDALALRVFRLVDDDVPLTVTTRYEIAAAGRARELVLPAALLPQFLALALDSPLPARLTEDGRLRLQLRPGNWSLSVTGRHPAPLTALALPKDAPVAEEVWSFRAHNDVRLVSIEGVSAVDPKHTGMPAEWHQLPAYRLRAGESMGIRQTRRGDPQPAPDNLQLARRIWLDFDGGGYTLQDGISGPVSRSWRLEVAAPVVLGRVAIDGVDQLVTQLGAGAPFGVEVRQGQANISADSRIEGATGSLPATAWQADFSGVGATLHLPPGWRLLHAGGVDRADGAWLAAWNLWDFFFVLVTALAAGRLFGLAAGVLFGLALALTWHLPGAPQLAWPVLLALVALARVLPQGRLLTLATWARRLSVVALLALLLPFAVTQVRQAIYPSLEQQALSPAPRHTLSSPAVPLPAAPPRARAMPADRLGKIAETFDEARSLGGSADVAQAVPEAPAKPPRKIEGIDPSARIQTGPGLPDWQWRDYSLIWQGPVERSQQLRLWLLPPAAVAALSLLGLVLLAAALWVAAGRPRRFGVPPAAALLALLWLVPLPPDAMAAEPAESGLQPASPVTPPRAILDELRDKLSAAPDCMPACASLSRLHLAADATRLRLRLELHAQQDVMVPLPGQPAQFRPDRVLAGNAAARLRRDPEGVLWAYLPRGVTQILMEAPVGAAASLQIALPMAPRAVSAELSGWTLAGLDDRGIAGEALVLERAQPTAAAREEGAQSDALPPFVRVERSLHLADRWTVHTTVTRAGPSRAPALARIALLAGEAVNDPAVRVEDGHAIVALGQSDHAAFASTLQEGAKLRLMAGREPNQVELWRLDADTRWHVTLAGIPPVHHQDGVRWLPLWQPWPGETVDIAVTRPQGVPGQTLTLDSIRLALRPGQRATDASASLALRSSQGGNHAIELPQGAQLLSVAIDGRTQPIRAEGRTLTLPVEPGVHGIDISWREPRAMDLRYLTSRLDTRLDGVNASLQVALPADRWVIALGGPLLGPAVLFWGVMVVIAALAWGLARSRLTPLRLTSWFLLGIGLAQASLAAAALVVGWFLALAARGRYGAALSRGRFNAAQVALAVWTVVALLALLEGVRAGLLGYPDMLIQGNASSPAQLNWYQDRIAGELPTAWVISVPLYAYRILMLAWALWLARAVLAWARWAWESYSCGGYWKPRPPGQQGWLSQAARRKNPPAAADTTA